jgi:formyltetrahydrofolate synthetase
VLIRRRCVDTNDRFLRVITIGQGAEEKKMTRETGFDIAVSITSLTLSHSIRTS